MCMQYIMKDVNSYAQILSLPCTYTPDMIYIFLFVFLIACDMIIIHGTERFRMMMSGIFSAILTLCKRRLPFKGGFTHKGPVIRKFYVFSRHVSCELRLWNVTVMILQSQVPIVIHVVTTMTSLFLVAVPLVTSPRETSIGLLLLLCTTTPYYTIVVRYGYFPKWLKIINSKSFLL